MPVVIKLLVALGLIIYGVAAYLSPKLVAQGMNVSINDAGGSVELRINLGGHFVGLGLGAVILDNEAAYQLLGIATLITFASRLGSLVLDGRKDVIRPEFIFYAATEFLAGILLFWPQ